MAKNNIKYLFIVESPGKVKKIQSFLGSEYKVAASVGHVSDLPPKKIGVKIKSNFEATYEVSSDKKDIVKDLKEWANKVDVIYLATDLDREGSMISQRLIDLLPKNKIYKRVKYSSITSDAIKKAIEEASDPAEDIQLVHSAETRRILDRIVGWKCSFITKQATGGPSAGRVQSAALRIIAEREQEIQNFVPKEYWQIEADINDENKVKVHGFLKKPDKLEIDSEQKAIDISQKLSDNDSFVKKYEEKESSQKAYPPFTTSTLYQSASAILGWSSKKTASVAQALYEASHISYIRSDSTFIVPEFIDDIRSSITTKYGNQYLPSKSIKYSNKSTAQEAHEAIRVIDISKEVVGVGDSQKLYEIIWKRTVASQMKPMISKRTSLECKCLKKYIMSANASKVIFDGWSKCWDYGNFSNTEIPEFKVGQKVSLTDIQKQQKFTQPPNRYNDSSIVKELEKQGIGRPSTYASLIDTLLNRKYVERRNKALHATETGIRVTDFLKNVEFCFVDLDFTSNLENDLDCIAKGDCEKLDILNDFWKRLQSDIENAKKVKEENSKSDYPCPSCEKGFLIKKFSKYGPFYTCSQRTVDEVKCEYKADVGKNGEPVEKKEKPKEFSDICCPNCGEPFIIRTNKKGGQYLGCGNWQQKECKGFYDMEGNIIEFKKKYYKKGNKKGKK